MTLVDSPATTSPQPSRRLPQAVRRTLRRWLRRQVLWNGNIEPRLWTVFTDPEHIVRWAWSTHSKTTGRIEALRAERPDLAVVRLASRSDVQRWVSGPLREAGD